jgi:folate-binding protein YgfZ
VPPPLGAAEAEWRGIAVRVLGEDGTSAEGVSVVADGADLDRARQALAGLPAMDAVDLEAWRIQRGLPGPAEMDEERNPLEAGLWDAVSFTKGCYVGQEVVARLKTYDKVVRTLVTLVLPPRSGVPPRGASLQQGERAVGAITSAVLPPGSASPMAMGFLRREVAATGTPITVVWDGDRVDATVASVSQARAA